MLNDLISEISENVESASVQPGTSATSGVSKFIMMVHESDCDEQF